MNQTHFVLILRPFKSLYSFLKASTSAYLPCTFSPGLGPHGRPYTRENENFSNTGARSSLPLKHTSCKNRLGITKDKNKAILPKDNVPKRTFNKGRSLFSKSEFPLMEGKPCCCY